jgi:hypothetical protein
VAASWSRIDVTKQEDIDNGITNLDPLQIMAFERRRKSRRSELATWLDGYCTEITRRLAKRFQ